MEIICYLSNGYPSIESSYQTAVEYADAGCSIMEIDFPSRNPYLEGEYIAGRMEQALQACDNYDSYMDSMVAIKKRLPQVKLLVLAYENTVEEIGTEKFIQFCLDNDFKDILFVGLKDNVIKDKLIASGLLVSCYVQFQLLPEEIELAEKSNGFVYVQAKPGEVINPKYPELKDCIAYLKERGIDRPIYCGVGIHTPEDVIPVKEAGADAVFVGKAILTLHEDVSAMKEMIKKFKEQC